MPRKPGDRTGRVLLEVCVDSVDDAVDAAKGGADRLELNAALSLDGLTPSPGLMAETRRAVRVPIIAMVRPRVGDFCYSPSELKVLRRDVELTPELGADGFAFGVLTADGRVDVRRCRDVLRRIDRAKCSPVFHRAFDAVRDPFEALEQLIDLGVRRVMTSGGRRTAAAGAAAIRRLVEQAAGRIEILPAGGIRPANARGLIHRTGCCQLHTSLRDPVGRMSTAALKELVRLKR